MRNFTFILLFFSTQFFFSQGITVDISTYTNQQLVTSKLLANDCISASNFSSSSSESVGYFNKSSSGFSLSEGIIIRSGKALFSAGQYTGNNINSQINTSSDPFLQQLSNANGQTEPITDVGFLEFDFIPVSNKFSFDFIFASNEYGQFQCGFSDVFAFVLTNLSTGISTNLAIVPGTTLPVSVKTIRNDLYNATGATCASSNPILFDKYNVSNPANSDLNMRGITKVLNASSDVIPNTSYKIRLAVGDYKDSNFDSAVFIKGGSFVTTLDLGPDQSICTGDSVTFKTNLNPPFTHKWFRNGTLISGATNATYVATQSGTYSVQATSGNCIITDTVVLTDLQVAQPSNLYSCDNGAAQNSYDLTLNNANSLLGATNGALYAFDYHTSPSEASAHTNAIPNGQLNSFLSNGQTIYIKLKKIATNSYCDAVYQFDLIEKAQIILGNPSTINKCNDGTSFNLNAQNSTILNGLPPAGYIVSFFNTQPDATNNVNSIPVSFSLPVGSTSGTVFVRVTDVNIATCFATVPLNLALNPLPIIDPVSDIIECSTYALPALTNGSYHFSSGGASSSLITLPYTVTDSGTYFVYNGPDSNGCVNEKSFTITMLDEYVPPLYGCDNYVIPSPVAGSFYSGAGGTGIHYNPGDIITVNNTTIYYYAVVNGVVCRDTPYTIPIYPKPSLSPISNVTVCNNYVLPVLLSGNYYTQTAGSGTLLPAGSQVKATTIVLPNTTIIPISMPLKLYNFVDNGQCNNEVSFIVNIIDTSKYGAITRCGSFQLPAVTIGGYFTQPNGGGTSIAPLTNITTSQSIYYFATTTDGSNCAANLKYDITINANPTIDVRNDITSCGTYYLPPLTNGNYYFSADGLGGVIPAYTAINATKKVWVYKDDGLTPPICKSDVPFIVTIQTKVNLDNSPGDQYTCNQTYTLTALTNGKYYTGSNGTGTLLPSGTIIRNATATLPDLSVITIAMPLTIYIYNNVLPDPSFCPNEVSFRIFINYISVGSFTDIAACNSYTLPTLAVGNYFYNTGGVNPIPASQQTFTATATATPVVQKVYVYAVQGDPGRECTDEKSFTVTVSKTPSADVLPNIEKCGSFTLPALSPYNFYFTGTGGTGTAYLPNDIISNTGTTTTTQTIYVRAISPSNSNCAEEKSFTLKLNPLLRLNVPDGILCVEYPSGTPTSSYTMNTNLDPNLFTVNWYLNGNQVGTGPSYTALINGTYTIKTIKLQPESGLNCNYQDTIIFVDKSSLATATVLLSNYFEDNTSVSVTNLEGYGNYVYQIDGGNYDTNSTFTSISSGGHILYIKDIKNDCGVIEIPFNLINFPKFFTPNGDGYNDAWNIFDLAKNNYKISIFDRFGKLIKQISTSSTGWDGAYNGKELPATDYWFVLNYDINGEPKELKGHFSLKR